MHMIIHEKWNARDQFAFDSVKGRLDQSITVPCVNRLLDMHTPLEITVVSLKIRQSRFSVSNFLNEILE